MGKPIDLISRAELERITAPLPRAWTLPPGAYTDPRVFAAEVERIFHREWTCVGRAEQVAEPGDYLCADLPSQPVVITRDRAGELHAISRVCLHRGMPVVEGSGNATRLTCPYHKWVYELDGTLRGAPMMEGAEGFDAQACRLPALRLETWEGFLFVNPDPEAAPLAPRLADLTERVRNYRFGDLVVAQTLTFPSPWNWKILVENFMEAYHHIGTHRETLEPAFPSRASSVPDNGGQPWAFLWMPGSEASAPEAGVPEAGAAESVVFADLTAEQRKGLFAAAVFPSFLLATTASYGLWYHLDVHAHDAMTLKIHVLLPPAVAAALTPGEKAEIGELVSLIHGEDIEANQGVWRGLHGALTTQGRLSPFEKALWQFNRFWAGRMAR